MNLTSDECLFHLRRFLDNQRRGLRVFYDDSALQTLAPAAQKMCLALFADGWKKELAMQLLVLTLYDMVILIGSKISPDFSSRVWLTIQHR